MNAFEIEVRAALGGWKPETVFLAAVSGGADSTAMLASLASLRDAAVQDTASGSPFVLHCLHVEHGLRSVESKGDAAFVEQLCGQLKIPCKVVSIPEGKIAQTAQRRGIGIEAAARLYRHHAWKREARRIGAERILVAHTRDDLLETVLMRILRGSGPAGLAAMPRSRGQILRPLLALRRADVLAYLTKKNVPFRTDATNADNRFLRNRIRNQLVPVLNELFPRWEKNLHALAETQALAAEFLAAEAAARVLWKLSPEYQLRTSAEAFFLQPEIIREEALFQGIDAFASRPSPREKARRQATVKRSALRQFTAGEKAAADFGAYRVRKEGGSVIIFGGKPDVSQDGFSLLIKEPGLYKLNGAAFEVFPAFTADLEKDETAANAPETAGFFASLPVVLRRGAKNDFIVNAGRRLRAADLSKEILGGALVSAVDRGGIAAFITVKPETARLEAVRPRIAENTVCCKVYTTGGKDV
ncbi:MAG: tRNA lysidine(34) synthetase TilS [Treponema sp.]|jgi:tRNA(Ile)-lysidine synthase|nr:tRNA lysidine(34) synthetase TilS [Treponema sp.]